jgi:hypothetical protein
MYTAIIRAAELNYDLSLEIFRKIGYDGTVTFAVYKYYLLSLGQENPPFFGSIT